MSCLTSTDIIFRLHWDIFLEMKETWRRRKRRRKGVKEMKRMQEKIYVRKRRCV